MQYFDLHCDTLCRCYDEGKILETNDFDVDIKRLSTFSKTVQTFACFIDEKYNGIDALNRFKALYSVYKSTDFNSVIPILSIENLSCLNGDIDNISYFKKCGVKICGLVWNGKNDIASGVYQDGGITEFGKEVVKRLEKEDIVVDISHLNEQGFYDLCDIATKPFIATHSNSKSVCNNIRNLSDEQFKIIVNNGGIVGINFYELFVGVSGKSLSDFGAHIDKFLSLGGEKSIAIGSDFDGSTIHPSLSDVKSTEKLYSFIVDNYSKQLANKVFYDNCALFFKML